MKRLLEGVMLLMRMSATSGQIERYDYEYRRNGSANLFVFLDPHRSWRKVKVTERRAAEDVAACMRDLVDIHYPRAERIRLVLDNLSTHSTGALYQAFPADEARRVLRRLEFHYVPKHASWLNMVEIEINRKGSRQNGARLSKALSQIKPISTSQNLCVEVLGRGGSRHRDQMALEPVARQLRHDFQGSRFFEEVRCSRHGCKLLFAAQLRQRCSVWLNELCVMFADNKQRGDLDTHQGRTGQIGTTASRDHRNNLIGAQGCRHKRAGGDSAGTDVADPKMPGIGKLGEPVRRADEPFGEQVDIEAQLCRPHVD